MNNQSGENNMPDKYRLAHGKHDDPAGGRCAMEWVAYIAGEPHTDQPVCVSPVLRSYGISLNDQWDDEQRQKLRPYLARCIGTAGDGRDMERAWMCFDWLVRESTPAWLDLTPSLQGDAAALRALSPIMSGAAVDDACHALREAQGHARAARDAAGAAAWAAAGAAARDAARAAAGAALAPTVTRLQASALVLFDRMLPTVPVVLSEPMAARARDVVGAGV